MVGASDGGRPEGVGGSESPASPSSVHPQSRHTISAAAPRVSNGTRPSRTRWYPFSLTGLEVRCIATGLLDFGLCSEDNQ